MHPTAAAAANLFRVVHEHARTAAEAEGGEGAFNFATAFKDNRMKCTGKNGEKYRHTNITISVTHLENRHLLPTSEYSTLMDPMQSTPFKDDFPYE